MNDLEQQPFALGELNETFAKFFIGKSYLNMLSTTGIVIANVTFEPGCRNNWHIHHSEQAIGQILLVTAGNGWYQEWGKPVRALHAGDVVQIPSGTKYWHGAVKDHWFSHLSLEIPSPNSHTEWLEPLADTEYLKL